MKTIVTLLLLAVALPVMAQPTFSSDQFLTFFLQSYSSGTTNYNASTVTGLQQAVNPSGANLTWDFSSIPFTLTSTTSPDGTIVPYSGTEADASAFTGATHVITSVKGNVTSYIFVTIDTSGFYTLGESQDSAGVATILGQYTPALQTTKFPLKYPDQWTCTSTLTRPGVSASITYTVNANVDGWGSITVGGSTFDQCLRMKKSTTTAVTGTPFSSSSGEFDWYNASGFSLSVQTDGSFAPTSASYSVPSTNSVSMPSADTRSFKITNNPTSGATSLTFTMPSDENVKIEVMDMLGKQSDVLMNGLAHSGANIVPISSEKLPNGTYFIRLESPTSTSMQKLVVVH